MIESLASSDRAQSRGEEIANSVTHGLALLAALIATPVLVLSAIRHGDTAGIVGASVFAATMVLLYLGSTLYHALPNGRAKEAFQLADHGAIFLLIAGSYTPFTLGVLRGALGWTLFGLVWGLALAGIALKVVGRMQHPILSTCLYIAMGWLLIIGGKQVWLRVPAWGLFWLLAGGIAYTAGVAFFAADRIRYGHLVWHLFVIAGTACHFIAVLWYAGHEGDVLPGGQMRKEAAVLEHVAHSPPEHHGVGTGQLGALEADEAGVRLGLDPSEYTG